MAKGIQVYMGLDDREFKKKLSDTKKELKESQKNIKAFSDSLVLKFDNTKFKNALKEAQLVIDKSNEKVSLLKNKLKELEKEGKVDTSQYKYLQRELNNAEIEARKLKAAFKDLQNIKIDNIANKFNGVGSKISNIGKKLAPLSAIAGAATLGLGKIATSTHKFADELQTASDRLGITSETMQKWQYIAMQTDVSQEELSKGFKTLNGTLAQLATGASNNATNALKKLGIGASDALKGLDANLDNIIDSLLAVENPTQRLALANEIFGQKIGQSLVPMLNQGKAGLKALKEEFKAAGYMTNEQVKNFADFDNKVNKLKHTLTNLKRQIGAALLPVMQSFVNFAQDKIVPVINKISDKFNRISLKIRKMIVGLLVGITALAPVFIFGGRLIKGIGAVSKAITFLNGKLMILAANPIVAIIAVVVALFVILYTKCEAFRNAINTLVATISEALAPIFQTLGEIFKEVGPIIGEIAKTIGEFLAPVIEMLSSLLGPLIHTILAPALIFLKMFATIFKVIYSAIKPVIDLLRKTLMPVLKALGLIVKGVGFLIQMVVFGIVKGIEWMVNIVIKIINFLLKPINAIIRFFGGKPIEIKTVDFSSGIDPRKARQFKDIADTKEKEVTQGKKGALGTAGRIASQTTSNNQTTNNYTTINNNNSNANKIEIKVENYGKEVNPDELAQIINAKLAKVGG